MVKTYSLRAALICAFCSLGLQGKSVAQNTKPIDRRGDQDQSSDGGKKRKKTTKSNVKSNTDDANSSVSPLDPQAWFDSISSGPWTTSKGILTRVHMGLASDNEELKKSYSQLDSSIAQESSFQFTNEFDISFTDRLNEKPDTSAAGKAENGNAESEGEESKEAKNTDPFQGAIPVDLAIQASEKDNKAGVTTKNNTKASWKFPKVLLKKPQLLPTWIEKNLAYHGVVLDYKKPYVLIRSNRKIKAKTNAIIYLGTDEKIIISKKDTNGMALAAPEGEPTEHLIVAKIVKVKGKLPNSLIGSKVKMLYPKSPKKAAGRKKK